MTIPLASALVAGEFQFDAPKALEADGERIETEPPGFAAPCLFDLDGDGRRDLLVGQYHEGKVAVYRGLETKDGTLAFGAREWLQAGGETAKVPGIW